MVSLITHVLVIIDIPTHSGNSNNLINITYDPLHSSVVCHFADKHATGLQKYCGVHYGPGRTCDNLTRVSEVNSTSNEQKLLLSIEHEDELNVCYIATASNGTYTIRTQGILSIGKPETVTAT